MRELKATTGDWLMVHGGSYCAIRTGSMEDGTGTVIADMRMKGGYCNIYDAHLIAAAPDLYEALESLMVNASPKLFSDGLMDQCWAALEKARGEQ